MTKRMKIIASALAVAFTCIAICGAMLIVGIGKSDMNEYYTPTLNSNVFFESDMTDIAQNVEEGNKNSINPSYDKFPVLNNPTNLQSLGTTSYENINGKTVLVDTYYRKNNEAANDPNAGAGLLLFQCIQYKIAHPEEDVSIRFSTYRLSVTASVCVLPNSRYYGYMRSLYTENYDEHGFVRLSYMLVEAARMGIDVTIVGQLDAYGVKQYNDKGELKTKGELSYKKYFNDAKLASCYEKYASGKKVSDFLKFHPVNWTLDDKGGTDMMHLKACVVSDYKATDGTEYEHAVWLSSTNLDAIDYRGANGNNGTQSGVAVTNHEDVYNAVANYIDLMARYDGQEELYEMQLLMREKTQMQVDMALEGRYYEIPKEERLVYVGSESDSVFEMYLTPLPSNGVDVWDTVYNPYVKYTDKLRTSTDYVEFAMANANFSANDFVADTIMQMLKEIYTKSNRNKENKIYLKLYVANATEEAFPRYFNAINSLKSLKVGEDVGYASINTHSISPHTKDVMFSYEEGERHYVTLFSSCNFHRGALHYQTNSVLIVHETDSTGKGTYTTFGKAYAHEMLK